MMEIVIYFIWPVALQIYKETPYELHLTQISPPVAKLHE